MTTLSPTTPTLLAEDVSYSNSALDAAETRALDGLKKGLEAVMGMQDDEAKRRVQHVYGNIASTIQNAVLAIKKRIPEAERTPEKVLEVMRARYHEAETSVRTHNAEALKALTDAAAPAADVEKLRTKQETAIADRKLAMKCLAETLKCSTQWTRVSADVESALQLGGGRQ